MKKNRLLSILSILKEKKLLNIKPSREYNIN